MEDKTAKVEWGPCCFCGLLIDSSEIDPCSVMVSTAQKKWQVWYCHALCFKARLNLDPNLNGLFDPAHF
jgi:hypothetical protein